MQEKIGNVVLDYEYYTGEDFYSDGSVEDELLEIAQLQLDDYSLSFGPGQGGTQTVNVTAGGKTTSFSIKINGVDESQLLEFNGIPELADGEVGFAALYDSDGRMLGVYEAHGIDGAVWIAAPSNLQWSEARLYVLNGTTWAPAGVYTNVNRA